LDLFAAAQFVAHYANVARTVESQSNAITTRFEYGYKDILTNGHALADFAG
jgi:hypothetical protein